MPDYGIGFRPIITVIHQLGVQRGRELKRGRLKSNLVIFDIQLISILLA
jgi:hypothetical protein